MAFCINCGYKIQAGQTVCSVCGASQVDDSQYYQQNVQVDNNQYYQQNAQVDNNQYYQQNAQVDNNQYYQQNAQVDNSQYYQQNAQVDNSQYYQQTTQADNNNSNGDAPKNKKNKKLIIGIVSGVIAAALIVAGIFLFTGGTNSEEGTVIASSNNTNTTEVEPQVNKPDEIDINTNVNNTAKSTTVMVYMIGSNLESEGGCASSDIWEMLNGEVADNVNVILQTGGSTSWSNPKIKGNQVQRFEIKDKDLVEIDNLGNISMVENSTLSDFISFATTNYKADQNFLILWDHGGGFPTGFGVDPGFEGSITYDELPEILKNGGAKIDALITDACDMCTLEVAMSLKGYVDYLVASEQALPGFGTYYTGWLGKVDDVSPRETCETISKEYKRSLDALGQVGCISVVDVNKIEPVMEAYNKFLADLDKEALGGKLSTYIQSRENSGTNQFDVIDIITLASWYKFDSAKQLTQAVKDSVIYYDGDIPTTNGLGVYSPYSTPEGYDYVRPTLKGVGYSDEAIRFYDRINTAVVALHYDVLATDYVWFDDTYLPIYFEGYNGSNISNISENNSAQVQNSDLQTDGTEYELAIKQNGSQYLVELTDEDWDIITKTETEFYYVDEDEDFLKLGNVYYYYGANSDGNVDIEYPLGWVSIAPGSICSYFEYEFSMDASGNYYAKGYVPVKVDVDGTGNEVYAVIDIYRDSEDFTKATILGYRTLDVNNSSLDELNVDTSTIYEIGENDIVTPLIFYPDKSGEYEYYYAPYGDSFVSSNMQVGFISLNENLTVLTKYTIYDIYGNKYSTQYVSFNE